MAKAFCQLPVNLTTNVSPLLIFLVFVGRQLFFLTIRQLSVTPFRPFYEYNLYKCLLI